jgi:hypothetical protein
VWFGAAAIGGAALSAGGGVTGLLALQRENDVSRFVVGPDGSLDDRKQLGEEADHLALASDVCFIAGGAALAGAALLYFLRAPEGEPNEDLEHAPAARLQLNLGVTPAGGGLQLHAAF